MSEIITSKDEQLDYHTRLLDIVAEKIELLSKNSRPFLNGECYITDLELSKI